MCISSRQNALPDKPPDNLGLDQSDLWAPSMPQHNPPGLRAGPPFPSYSLHGAHLRVEEGWWDLALGSHPLGRGGMASVSSAQRQELLSAKSQETRQKLESNAKRQQCYELDEDEVNRALEEEARLEEEEVAAQERLEALFTISA